MGGVGAHKEGLVPRAVAVLHHLVQTSQHKGNLTVTQAGQQAALLRSQAYSHAYCSCLLRGCRSASEDQSNDVKQSLYLCVCAALMIGATPQLVDLQCPGAAPHKLPHSCD